MLASARRTRTSVRPTAAVAGAALRAATCGIGYDVDFCDSHLDADTRVKRNQTAPG